MNIISIKQPEMGSGHSLFTLRMSWKRSRIPGFTDAVFMLYEISSDSADGLMDQINKTKQKTARDGKRHSFSFGLGEKNDRGVSFVCRTDDEMLSEDMFALGASKKYQLRANEWLTLRFTVSNVTNKVALYNFHSTSAGLTSSRREQWANWTRILETTAQKKRAIAADPK